MEQTIQQTDQKPTLPIKTKIASLWMIIFGVLGLVWGCFLIVLAEAAEYDIIRKISPFFVLLGPIFSATLLIFSSWLLFKRKKKSWKLAITSLLVFLIFISLIIFLRKTIHPCKIGTSPCMYVSPFPPILISIIEGLYYFFAFPHPLLSLCLFIFIPFILLLLDRKNFWKIAK